MALPLLALGSIKNILFGPIGKILLIGILVAGCYMYVNNHKKTVLELENTKQMLQLKEQEMINLKETHEQEIKSWELKYNTIIKTLSRRNKDKEVLESKIRELESFRDSTAPVSSPVLLHTFETLMKLNKVNTGVTNELPK
jgi:hypothetical protein